jgi:photosystem II stability/assembly factor-like uncharacterized protein
MKSYIRWAIASLVALGLLMVPLVPGPSVLSSHRASEDAVGPMGLNNWTKTGPMWDTAYGEAPQVIQILIDPSNPNIVYAGTNQGVYRSTDGGETWEPRNGGLGGYGDLVVSGIARHPTNPDILIIATWGYGLFRSTDAGRNWTRLADPLASGTQATAALPPGLPEVRAGGYSYSWGMPEVPEPAPGKPFAPGTNGLLRPRSVEPFVDLQGLPRNLSWTPVRRVAIHPGNANEIYACIDAGKGLYKSTNGGSTWSRVNLGPPAGVITASARTYVFAPSNSNIRYASFGSWGASGGFYRTTDGGSTWTEVGGSTITRTVIAVAIHPTNPNIVLAGTSGGGLYRSTDGGNSWTLVSAELADSTFFSVAFAPSNPNIAYAGGYNWVYISTDGGQTWSNADSYFPTWYVEGLAIHPNQPDTVLVGANFFPWGGVYKRTSSTASFALKASGMDDTFVLRIEQDPNNSSTLYAATWGGGAFRSDDSGNTWYPLYAFPYIYDIEATRGPTGTILYAGTFYSDWGVLKSYDGGYSWTEISWGYDSDISFDIESLDGSSTNLLAATAWGVQYSTNGGQSWTTANGLNDGVVLKLAVSPTSPSNVLAATYGGGVWRSTNYGQGWSESSNGLPSSSGYSYVYDVAFAPNGTTAYAATYGVYKSTNSGQNWSAAYTGANDWFRALDVASDGTVVAGSSTKGVYFGLSNGTSWMQRNTGLTELRIRAVKAFRNVSPLTVMAGTNGRSGWLYTLRLGAYLPVVLRSYLLPSWTVITSQDFEGAFPGGWQVSDDYPGYGEYYWGKRNCRPYAGSYSGWAVGGGANGSSLGCGSNYPNYAESWMDYGPFSLAGATAAELRFKLWLNSELNYDWFCVIASPNGTDWDGPCISGSTGGWVDRVLNLANVPTFGNLLGDSSVWVSLGFFSDGSVTRPEGAYVDNIVLRKCMYPSCPATASVEEVLENADLVERPAHMVLNGNP